MTATPATPAPSSASRRRRFVIVALAVALAVTGYLLWRYWDRPEPPTILTEGMDPEVRAAIARARAEVEKTPRSGEAWGRLGRLLFAQNLYAECLPILAQAEKLDPGEVRWPYLRGLALVYVGTDDPVAALQRAAALRPDLTVNLRLAEHLLKVDRPDEAEPLFRAVLRGHANNPRALLGIGQIALRRGRCKDALTPLRIAAEQPEARKTARLALAEALMRLDDRSAAEAELQLAAQVPGDVLWPDPYLREAQALQTGHQPRIDTARRLISNGQVDEAIDLLQQVLRDHPASDEAYLTLGKALIGLNDLAKAEKPLSKAIELNSNLVEGHLLLGTIHLERQNYAAAEKSYRRTLDLKPTEGWAWFNLGQCRLKQNDKPGALTAWRRAAGSRPDLAVIHLSLGELLLETGQVGEAIRHLETAVRLEPNSDKARTLLAQARAKLKG